MKLIIAIIQPSRLEAVKAALTEVEVFRLTVMDVQGFGRQKGHTEVYRGHEFSVNLLRKVQLQIAVNEEFVEPTIAAIVKGGRSGPAGEIGDGKISSCRWKTASESAPANAARKRSEPAVRRARVPLSAESALVSRLRSAAAYLPAAQSSVLPTRQVLAQQHSEEVQQRHRAGHQQQAVRIGRRQHGRQDEDHQHRQSATSTNSRPR